MISNLALCLQAASPKEVSHLLSIYGKVGNGPILMAPTHASRFFREEDRTLVVRSWIRWRAIPMEINAGRPCALLLRLGLREWHWVLCVGWRRYESGQLWLRLADGWHPQATFFSREHGASFVYAASFQLVERD